VKRFTAAVLVVLLSTPAYADELKYVPKWSMCGDKACYTFDQAKKLVEIDLQLNTLLLKEVQWMQLNKDLQEGAKQLQLALTAEKNVSAQLKTNGEQLTTRLMSETERANKAEARPGSFPAWAIGGAVGVGIGIIAGILLGVYVAK
jgi:hypothetical protein